MFRSSATTGGDEAEFLAFATGRHGQLYRSACLLTGGDTYLAEDLVQETLSRMYAVWRRTSWLPGLSLGKRIDNPVAYAHSVLVRQFLSHKRRLSNTERPSGELPDLPGRTADNDLRVALLQGLALLPPKDRAVLVLRYWEDRSIEETAELVRSSPGAVRTRSTRALGRLRELLGEHELALLG
ncbi:SigE family RNA polymerase sigma factor [Kitasatospora sp. McL0602]|uniref:SigE family RNA polymerase sigma factor n=1 Tax=Kitasatospora sp. McL0602 TaxID=3439530 RepID=UPI003F89FE16